MKRFKAIEIWFYQQILRIPGTQHVNNKEVVGGIGTTKKLIFTIRKRELKFLGNIMKKHGSENLILIGHIEGKRSRVWGAIYLMCLSGWITKQNKEGQ